MKKIILPVCVTVVLLAGCILGGAPGLQNCDPQPRYVFNQFGHWLHMSQSILDVSDPLNPAPYISNASYWSDSLFTIGVTEYGRSRSELSFDSVPHSYNQNTVVLSASPTHLASTQGVIYFLRHVDTANTCRSTYDTINALEVDDITKDSTMTFRTLLPNPQDIAINGTTLYVLDAKQGLMIYSLAEARHPALLSMLSNISGYHMDLTPQQTLIVHSIGGLTQYDVSNPTSPVLLAKIQ